jgi:molybdate transport system substrate-binding protein
MRTSIAALGALALAALAGCSSKPAGGTGVVRVAAAADLQFALGAVVAAFRQARPDVQVEVKYDASGNIYAQLSNRAPFDVFLSADRDYPRALIEKGLADKDSAFTYAVGHLVVWVPNESGLDLNEQGARTLLDPSVRKIALANPRHAPYGRAAEAALKSLKLYDRVKDRLVPAQNVAQAAQMVEHGGASAGLIALSLALAPPLRHKGRFWEVPLEAYPRLEQGGVILSWAQDRAAAEALRAFLLGAEGQAVLRRYGLRSEG